MKFSTRVSVFVLVLVMLAACIGGCSGGNKTDNNGSNGNGADQSAQPTPEPAPLYITRTAPEIEKAEAVEPTAEKFKVSNAFSNNMVLQRDDYIRIWGTAEEDQNGKTVCAEFMGLKGSAEIKDGKWLITLDGTLGACADKGNTLRVYSASKEFNFKDVLVGDVYMVIGQSNAAYLVANFVQDSANDEEAKSMFTTKDIKTSDNIRIIRNVLGDPTTGDDPTSELAEDVNHKKGWRRAGGEAMNATAIGYFFAKQLITKTNNEIPIGIIECSASGYALAGFMTPEVAEARGLDSYNNDKKGYYAECAIGAQQSRLIYNQYINPFMNFTISGIIWYQGESDCSGDLPKAYSPNFAALIEDYRNKINQNYHDFPVFVIELPTEYTKPADHKYEWAYMDVGGVRAYMGLIPSMLPNSFIAASSDLWKNDKYWNSLHPYCKWPMAGRAVDIAMPILYEDYVKDTASYIEYTAAPTYARYERSSDKDITLYFNFCGEGLKVNGDAPAGFEVLVGNDWTAPKDITVVGNTVRISHDSDFTAVRYDAVTTYSFPETVNVSSSTGVPMAAFCWDSDVVQAG